MRRLLPPCPRKQQFEQSWQSCHAYHELNFRHIDIDTAFFYGELEEDVYMKQPKGYIEKDSENKVCELK